METQTFLFKPELPYDLNLSLQRLKREPIYVFQEDAVYRTLKINRSLYLLKIHYQEQVNAEVKVEVACLKGTLESDKVRDMLERMLAIHCDLNDIYGYMNRIPELKPLTRNFEGLQLFQDPDLFETMMRLIIAQQITTSFALELLRNLMEAASKTVEYENQPYSVFPNPSQVAKLSLEDLTSRKFSGRKAEYVIDFAKLVRDGKIDLDELRGMSDEEVSKELLKIRGVGPWTVSCLLLFALGRNHSVPVSDIGVQKAIQQVYGRSKRPTKNEVLQLSDEWRPVGSYVTRYLWETLRA
ncbi:MAG TPA: DNA-3-methyladenine glycosylase [Bacillales bacterium]|nr:DNA-3-methyladenine glycosylase [Bacillales bacterium]